MNTWLRGCFESLTTRTLNTAHVIFVVRLYITVENTDLLALVKKAVLNQKSSALRSAFWAAAAWVLLQLCCRRTVPAGHFICITGSGIPLRQLESGTWLPADGSSERQASVCLKWISLQALVFLDWRRVLGQLVTLLGWLTCLEGMNWKLSPEDAEILLLLAKVGDTDC